MVVGAPRAGVTPGAERRQIGVVGEHLARHHRAEFPEHRRVPHWETGTALGILDNERATKISGAMFTMQRGNGAALSRALCQYALDRNVEAASPWLAGFSPEPDRAILLVMRYESASSRHSR